MKAFKITIEEKYGRYFITGNFNGKYERYEAYWVGDDCVINVEHGEGLLPEDQIKSLLEIYKK